MLVLGRKAGERIMIGHDIIITVIKVSDARQVRLGIEAPSHLPVHREEVYLDIQQGKGKSA